MTGSPDPVLDATRALVTRVAGPTRTPPVIGPETPLSDAGFWLDSVDLLEVIVACEAEFAITFDGTLDFADGTLETLGTLTALIRSKHPRIHPDP